MDTVAEDPWSNTIDELSHVCNSLLRINSDFSPASYQSFSDDGDNDDDPLGHPEISVRINDDWSVSPDKKSLVVANEREIGDEDDAEVGARDGIVLDSFLNILSPSQELSSDEEDQLVPSSAKKVCKVMLGKESTLPVNEQAAKREEEKEEIKEKKEEEEEEDEAEQEEEEKDVPDKKIGKRSDVEEVTQNRSSPQPP